jgi:hypothetical protein
MYKYFDLWLEIFLLEKIYLTCGEAPQIASYIYTKLIEKKGKHIFDPFSFLSMFWHSTIHNKPNQNL